MPSVGDLVVQLAALLTEAASFAAAHFGGAVLKRNCLHLGMVTPSIAPIGNISEEWFDRMAPRTSASALGMTFVKEELEPEAKLVQVAKEENWGSEKTERGQEEKGEKNALRLTLETMSINKSQVINTRLYMVIITCLECRIGCKVILQVNLVNFKLPLGLSLKRGRNSQDCSGKDERELKKVKIQNDGQELVVNCGIGKPRCLLCR